MKFISKLNTLQYFVSLFHFEIVFETDSVFKYFCVIELNSKKKFVNNKRKLSTRIPVKKSLIYEKNLIF